MVPTPSRSATCRIERASTPSVSAMSMAAATMPFSVRPERPASVWEPQRRARLLAGSAGEGFLWFTSMFSHWDAVTALFLTLFYHTAYSVRYNVRHATLLVALERVLPLHMVDNSISPRKLVSGWFYPHSAVQAGCFIL